MPHDYRNYVHLEGIVSDQPIITPTPRGATVQFTIAVRGKGRDANGTPFQTVQLFPIELRDAGGWILNLRRDTKVIVDGTLRTNKTADDSPESSAISIRAHRIHSLDFTDKKEPTGQARTATTQNDS